MLSGEDLRFFDTLAKSASLAAASRTLDVTASAVTQRLRQIEARLGIRLIDRSGRGLKLTDEGALLSQRSREILDDINALETELTTRRDIVSGQLRVVAPLGFGRSYVADIAARFRMAFPSVALNLTLSDRPGRDESQPWDILINIGELRDSSLVAQRLAPNDRIVCASPDYIARKGMVEAPDDLRHHDCIALRENEEDVTLWRFQHVRDGRKVSQRIDATIASNDGDVVKAWGLAGLGIISRSEWHVADDIKAGRLVPIMPEWQAPPAPVMALVRDRHGRSARTARFIEHLREGFRPVPWRS
ncbi:MAG: LysR family transcriptional regulator [Asticcacaulis sp.]|uniref:LysR family transcriptional regulator n=1 Tax=Asticcacaulis sp. TaxID=1872648 RepID=UPI0039E3078B